MAHESDEIRLVQGMTSRVVVLRTPATSSAVARRVVLPDVAIRQYVLSPPSELVALLRARGETLSALARIFVRCMFDGIVRRVDAGTAHPGAVVVVQRFSKTIALFRHLHVVALDGAYVEVPQIALTTAEPVRLHTNQHVELSIFDEVFRLGIISSASALRVGPPK